MTSSGPPLMERHGPDRLRLALLARAGVPPTDVAAALERRGARQFAEAPLSATGQTRVTDPDDNEFRLLWP